MESKTRKNGDLRAAKLVNPVAFIFLNEGGEFLGAENFPLPLFNPIRAGVARLGELRSPRRANLHFFFGYQISMASYGSAFAYSNPLRVD